MPHRLALLLLSLAVAACAAAPGPSVPPVSSNAGPAVSVAAPRLVVRLLSGGGWPGTPGRHVADYLADGTVIQLNGATLETNRLTETGLASLRATLAMNAELLATPMRIAPRATVIPAEDPTDMALGVSEGVNTFVLERPDGSRYTVTAPDRHPGDLIVSDPDPVVDGLTALAEALSDPATLAGAGGLADPAWTTYQPAKTAVFLTLEELADPSFLFDGVIPHVGPTDWPFENAPHAFGTSFKGPGLIGRRCAFLPSAEAGTALASLSTVGGQRAAAQIAAGRAWRSDVLIWVDGSKATFLGLQALALMPEDSAVSCIDALSN
jgi:hypothetical protein